MTEILELKLKEKIQETPDTCTLLFENAKGGTVFYKPGQFLSLVVEINGQEWRRSYSLCTLPIKDKVLGITVKKVKDGVVSNYLHNDAKIGDTIRSLYPLGRFSPDLNSSNRVCYFLIAIGSGIVPLFSILKGILAKEPHSVIRLIYGSRDEQHIIFQNALQEIELQNPERVHVVHVLSKPTADWQGFRGRISPELLKNLIAELKGNAKACFFLCGPEDFMQMAQAAIMEEGVDVDDIKRESFYTQKGEETTPIAKERLPKEVIIRYRSQEHVLYVPEGSTILDAALENGIQIPYSCTSGVCTACIATCLEGEVDISKSDALSENEKKKGYVLTCIGKPLTDKTIIQID